MCQFYLAILESTLILMNYSTCKNTTALTTTWSRSDRRRGLNLDLVVAHADGQGVLECFNTIENDCWIPLTSLPEESGLDGVTIAGYRNKVRNYFYTDGSNILHYND